MEASNQISSNTAPQNDKQAFESFLEHSDAHRVATGVAVLDSLRKIHRDYHVTLTSASTCDLLAFARAGNAKAELEVKDEGYLSQRVFKPSARRLDESPGTLNDHVNFGKYHYHWDRQNFLVYLAEWVVPMQGSVRNFYILSERSQPGLDLGHSANADQLILTASKWCTILHKEIYVFDSGMWTKNRELYKDVQKATWEEVILDSAMKKSLVEDIEGFFDRKDIYKEFAVPWKRGIIFHGEPGNGKTISIKALMHALSIRSEPVPALYVKSFDACQGPQYSVRQIFVHARNMAPCLLIFEDIDSLVTDQVRSYFLNEVDGLESNEGILMIGSTNHLEKLDAGISKRPSRFDRKYHYKLPGEAERAAYCEYWRGKLDKNPSMDFPSCLSPAIAKITEGFSFAYMKELFVTALLIIVGRRAQEGKATDCMSSQSSDSGEVDGEVDGIVVGKADGKTNENGDGAEDEFHSNLLMQVIKRQVHTLRNEMDNTEKRPSKVPGNEARSGGRRLRMGHQ
ncbi:hypothetical protein MMC12_005873, partial [Toensbergia leucococca]|nr:hypothetical protein [Toensbergia leucococca]